MPFNPLDARLNLAQTIKGVRNGDRRIPSEYGTFGDCRIIEPLALRAGITISVNGALDGH